MADIVDFSKAIDTTVLKDKVALVTGGASGLGREITYHLAKHKVMVTIADINAELGEAYAMELRSQGLQVHFVPTDVTSWASQIDAFQGAIGFSGVGKIDIVVAAASVGGQPFGFWKGERTPSSFEVDPTKSLDLTIDVNLKGVYYTSQLAAHYFGLQLDPNATSTVRKSLTILGSPISYCDFRLSPDYAASKWGVRGLFRAIRTPMKEQGYRVNHVASWIMDTSMIAELKEDFAESGRPIGDSKDIADIVIRCAADDTIEGHNIIVGGFGVTDLRDDSRGLGGAIGFKNWLLPKKSFDDYCNIL